MICASVARKLSVVPGFYGRTDFGRNSKQTISSAIFEVKIDCLKSALSATSVKGPALGFEILARFFRVFLPLPGRARSVVHFEVPPEVASLPLGSRPSGKPFTSTEKRERGGRRA